MIVVVDYGLGNLGSIVNMGRRLSAEITISGDLTVIAKAEKLILPGVGAFDHGMQNLEQRGLRPVLDECVLARKIPVLGICLGMQLLARRSEEGVRPGLGWLAANVVRFRFDGEAVRRKVPHMGWSEVAAARPDPLLRDLGEDVRFYFVHSYYLVCDREDTVIGWTDYGLRFASCVRQENIWGTQFHPEKSHKYGMQLLKNFITAP